ncbi:hypothetical protein SEA_SUPERCHUNK_41 [Mycobacterium phage Superchunk]|nr:hypothetical protein ODIN_41 [Mycobacterium phage Odin]QGJ89741.1 hypothetical protein SEA_SUPERCHUNK_41 [Mycobacterium phage Superchunk]
MRRSPTWITVVSSTAERAAKLAESLGLVGWIAYGANEGAGQFEGARTHLALIEKGTQLPDGAMDVLYGNVVKLYQGQIIVVEALRLAPEGW